MIKTKRLELVNFDLKYSEDLYELWSDFEVIKYTNMPVLDSIDKCREKIKVFIDHTEDEFVNNFIILLDNKAVGIIGALCINKEDKVFGLYYQLARKYWGKGYISEAIMEFKKHMAEKCPEAIYMAEVVLDNTLSVELLKKFGLKQIEIKEKAFVRNNFQLDIAEFSSK